MQVSFEEFSKRLARIEGKIAEICGSCGRDPGEVKIMAVTKTHPVRAAEWAVKAGLFAIGENRVQEAVEKIDEATFKARWELIGHLQSNKAKQAVSHFARIQSVDSAKLIQALDREAEKANQHCPILLQVNTGGDPGKFGVSVGDAGALLDVAREAPNLIVEGLMTIAPLVDADPGPVARQAFCRLRELRDLLRDSHGLPLNELSMGMTGDMEPAIMEGSTLIRIGSALFGART